MAKSSRPLIVVNNGIHAGEIEGKDAWLILMREMLLEGKHRDLFAEKAGWWSRSTTWTATSDARPTSGSTRMGLSS